ncbi:MFS family permease [Actinoplanes lutulentus]|uniref:MFS transporter n=1 Tax=Actinoplanes lutulentus TaxID=1287878 RepID=UPI000DBA0606|nr:MFS transporter [Actinoplanes lutulentus]MBB2948104.1 MFS family permease [Actinoplanes lutulentus]
MTFREVFGLPEFRALFSSGVVDQIGDYLSRAAVTALVYQQSQSVLLSATSFAISYLPWLFGPLLSALAERYPHRRVMITSDLCRMVLISLLLLPGLPVPVMFVLLFLSGLGAPPSRSARSAMLPLVVGRDRLALAVASTQTSGQAAQVIGYLAGATLSVALTPRIALGLDVLTFALSAAIVAFGIRRRPAESAGAERTHLLQETFEGFRLVFGDQVLRSITIVVYTVTIFAIVPEGLAAAWAAEGTSGPDSHGLDQGMIMAAGPLGFVIGGILFNRFVPAARRVRLIPLLAVIAPLLLVPTITGPPAPIVALLVLLAGLLHGSLLPTLNATFVLALPHGFRARAFGVVNSGIQLSQFGAVMLTGMLADRFWLPTVVGLWSIGGTLAMLLVAIFWPRPVAFAEAAERASASVPSARQPTTSVTSEQA